MLFQNKKEEYFPLSCFDGKVIFIASNRQKRSCNDTLPKNKDMQYL
jgi:hypothetical protein